MIESTLHSSFCLENKSNIETFSK